MVLEPLTKVHVFEPNRVKRLIQPPQRLPNFTPKHQERSGRLLDLGRFVVGVEVRGR